MALTHLSLTTLYGADALIAGSGSSTTVTFKPAQLGVDSNVTTPESLAPEGILLAQLQAAYEAQGASSTRVLEMTRSTPVVVTRGGDVVQGERYVVTIYSGVPVDVLDPDDI